MRVSPSRTAFAALACLLLAQCGEVGAGNTPKIRPAAVAGSFYPGDPKVLAQTVDNLLAQTGQAPLDAVALISPHAGYEFAGPVAAYAYATLKGRKLDRVVVIAPSHYEAFRFSSVYDGAAYTTPLGQIPVDHAFAAKLAAHGKTIRLSGVGHTPTPDRPEHSVEVELPWLQRALGHFELVPIVMGSQSYEACRELGLALAKLIQDSPNTLIVASSDLAHYHPYDDDVKLDRKTLNAITEWDYLSMSRNFAQQIWEACGGGPIMAAMIASERLGATEAKMLKYANSGDVPGGDRARVVGYGSVALLKAKRAAETEAPFTLGDKEEQELLRIARLSVETAVRDRKTYLPPAPVFDSLALERGAFVTLKERGELRGCIGYVAPVKPLYITVRDVARLAALDDTRFRPVEVEELPRLEYEISVLSPMRRVLDTKEIVIGRDGLLLRRGGDEGLLLPQVPVEQRWSRGAFLEEVSVKAGLPPRAWQDSASDLFRFTALVFGERK